MAISSQGRAALLVFCLGASGLAQVHPGQAALALDVKWLQAAPKELGSAVVGFYRDAAEARIDADVLRHAAAGGAVRACAIVHQGNASDAAVGLDGILVGLDQSGAVRARWLGSCALAHVVLVHDGVVAWVGVPAQGLCAVARAAAAGTLSLAQQADLRRLRVRAAQHHADAPAAEAMQWAEQTLAMAPTDGVAWLQSFGCSREKLGCVDAAARTLAAAVEALRPEPRALAVFADQALRLAPGPDAAKALLPALQAAAAEYPADVRVQLACCRALMAAGERRAAARLAHQLAPKVMGLPELSAQLVDILTRDEIPEVHELLGRRILHAPPDGGADPRLQLAARYQWTLLCARDADGARDLVADYLERSQGRASLNNDLWSWLVEPRTSGLCSRFAQALAERMLEHEAALAAFELDTAALAMLRCGQFSQAVRLQRLAVERSGDVPVYTERLLAYEALAARAAPR